MRSVISGVRHFANLVALPHSVFALPFALASFLIASQLNIRDRVFLQESTATLFGVVVAIIAARTAAMGFNRIVDLQYDRCNPRTQKRELPSGRLSLAAATSVVIASSLIFIAASATLGLHCLLPAPLVLGILFFYSFTKRFTYSSHLVLGLCLALAPGGAWWVLRPGVEATPLLIMAGVLFWVAGFDIIYSLQDIEFDRSNRLFSFPARFGARQAVLLARGFHLLSFFFFILVGYAAGFGQAYYIGVLLLSTPLAAQHCLVTPADFSRVERTFFTFNGMVSIGYFLLVAYTC